MFPIETASDLSDAQSLFLHWIELYDWVFSLPVDEKPSEYVIEDDGRFDSWHNAFVAKKTGQARKGSDSASSHSNVINF